MCNHCILVTTKKKKIIVESVHWCQRVEAVDTGILLYFFFPFIIISSLFASMYCVKMPCKYYHSNSDWGRFHLHTYTSDLIFGIDRRKKQTDGHTGERKCRRNTNAQIGHLFFKSALNPARSPLQYLCFSLISEEQWCILWLSVSQAYDFQTDFRINQRSYFTFH